MIHSAIETIRKQLNNSLTRTHKKDPNDPDLVVVSNIMELNGNVETNIGDLALFLINIEKDSSPLRQPNFNQRGADRLAIGAPPIYLNLYLMVAGCCGGEKYSKSLELISSVISIFQGQPVIDHNNTPDLHKNIDKLVLDIENLSIQDFSNLWGVLSGKYLPSVLYKVRMVAFDSGDILRQEFALKEPVTSINN